VKIAYVAHPFLGKRSNVRKVEKIIKRLLPKYPGYVFYSPLHATGFYYHDVPYQLGMEHCLTLLSKADELWLCEGWQQSRGCNMEVRFARDNGIPIFEIVDGVVRCLN
jgi:hypothetical protein